MESYKISQLPQAESITEDDLLEVSVSSDSTYDSAKATVGQIATATMTEFSYDNLSTEDKTIIGAINELIGSGPSVVVEPLSVTENGTYTAEEGKAYSPVTVNVKSDIEHDGSVSEWWDDSYLVPITVDGNPVTINSPMEQNAISALLSYSPKQEGTGDPSPVNIRPFIGKTGAELTRAGKNIINLADIQIPNGSAQTNIWSGTITGRYTLSFTDKDITSVANPDSRFVGITLDGSRVYPTYNQVKNGYTFDGELSSISIYGYGAYSRATGKVSFQLEVGQTATAYEPYNGTDYTISFGDTYYNFNVNVTTGTLTVTHTAEVYDGTEEGWTELSGSRGYYIPINGSDYNRAELLKCSCLIGTNAGSSASMPLNSIMLNSSKINLLCRVDTDTDFPTVEDWKDFLEQNPMMVVFSLLEPITYNLTPQEIELLEGTNTLSTDGDNISLTYRGEQANAPLLGMLGNAVLTQNSMVESEPTEESLTEVEENVSE